MIEAWRAQHLDGGRDTTVEHARRRGDAPVQLARDSDERVGIREVIATAEMPREILQ
jgi:hypothetical protein